MDDFDGELVAVTGKAYTLESNVLLELLCDIYRL